MNTEQQSGPDILVRLVFLLMGLGLYVMVAMRAVSDPKALFSLLAINFFIVSVASIFRRWQLLALHGAVFAGYMAYSAGHHAWQLGALGISFLGIWVARYLIGGDVDKSRFAAGPSQGAALHQAIVARFTFRDVVGMDETKAQLFKAGQDIRKSSKARNGILLFGAPGNGKTFFAEALAGELKLPFLSVSFGDMASMWVGETTQNAMKIFDEAERQAPCMLFIDEIDSVFVDRSKVMQAEHEAPKTLNAILKRLVDIRGKGVVVVAATNFIDRLDVASIREGRFDFKIEIPVPDFDARKALLEKGLSQLVHPPTLGVLARLLGEKPKAPILVDWDGVTRAARRWEGYSVARINAIVREVIEQSDDGLIDQVTFDELMAALRKIQAGKGDRLPEDAPTLDGLVLAPDMKAKLANVASRMTNIEMVEQIGGSVPAGLLFYGPPGTGKTIGVMALAKTTGWSFVRTTGHDMLADPQEIDRVLKQASDIRPCIVFIDEADDVLADRRMSAGSKAITNKLIAAMDGAAGRTRDLVFVAATNNPDLIDQAALRGGRFTEKIGFDLPANAVLLEFVQKWIANSKAPLSGEFTAEAVTSRLQGQSLANVKEILLCSVNQIFDRLADEPDARVGLEDLEAAIRTVGEKV
jgi:transitional endoplasmic reticulum ATPase